MPSLKTLRILLQVSYGATALLPLAISNDDYTVVLPSSVVGGWGVERGWKGGRGGGGYVLGHYRCGKAVIVSNLNVK